MSMDDKLNDDGGLLEDVVWGGEEWDQQPKAIDTPLIFKTEF